jgi:type II secretory pathway component GspD/PulD (secretin)
MKTLLALVLALAAQLACAQALEVISLRYRTADQVLDTLRPLVEPGGVLTGQGNQLIVRASAANIAQIRRALDAIDRPQRRLQVSVRFDDAGEVARRELGASGTISNRGARVEVRGEDSQARALERVDQRVQVMDGGRATILTGQSRPVRQRQYIQTPGGVVSQEVTVVQETTSGFEVVPRVSGSTATVEIFASRAGSTTASSVASGPLGEWFELGVIAASAARDERGIGSASRATASESRRVWVKVEALD